MAFSEMFLAGQRVVPSGQGSANLPITAYDYVHLARSRSYHIINYKMRLLLFGARHGKVFRLRL